VPIIEALARAGVPVLGHVGLTPQTASALAATSLQGKDEENARASWKARRRSSAPAAGRGAGAGAFAARAPVTERIAIPTIGIGAGAHCDGQVLVFHDLVGLFSGLRRASSSATRKPARRSRTPSPAMPPTCATAAFRPKAELRHEDEVLKRVKESR